MDLLQGKWLGHPLHPAIVHIPVGAWLSAAVIDVVRRHAGPGSIAPVVALFCVVVGLIVAALAVPTGVAEWTPIKQERPAWKLGLYHMILNLVAALVWAANLGLRWKALPTSRPITDAVVVTSVVAAVLVLVSSYLGSLMVFAQGTSVGRQSKKKWRALAERGGANVPEAK